MTVTSSDPTEFLRLLHQPGDILELRSFNCPVDVGRPYAATASGYFNDPDRAALAVSVIERHLPPGIYVTLNPAQPDLLARAANHINWKAIDTTKDEHVIRRRWLFIDIDPVRPAGISATDAETEAALALGRSIREALRAEGWPEPIFGMSGNGCYLLYRIEEPNDAETATLLQRVLVGLGDHFDTPSVKIDRGVFNASRIAKVLGTVARKGDDFRGVAGIEDRPHRQSWFEAPEAIAVVPRDLLAKVAKAKVEKPASVAACAVSQSDAGSAVVARCKSYIRKMPDAISGKGGHSRTLTAACECYRFGLSDTEAAEVMREFNETKTAGEPWTEGELAHKLTDAKKKVIETGEFGRRLRPKAEPEMNPPQYTWRSSAELASSDDKVTYLVNDVWPEAQGGIISGRFKTLKRSVAIDLAIAASTGGLFLDRFRAPSKVRIGIMSAESGWPTLRERGRAVAHAKGLDLADCGNLIWSTDSPKLGRAEHIAELRRYIIGEGLKGLLIDPTYLAMCDLGDSVSNVYKMGAALSPLTELISETRCSIVLLNHNKKGRAADTKKFDPPDLGEISMAGFAEWARFWLLLGPRQEWDHEAGQHWLWLLAGGSAGHAGLWHLDVTEGKPSDDGSRRWEPSIVGAAEGKRIAKETTSALKEVARQQAAEKTKADILTMMGRLGPNTKTAFRNALGISGQRFDGPFADLITAGLISTIQVRKANRSYDAYRLAT